MNNNKSEKGHALAYLIWDTDSLDELRHLHDVFISCMKIRSEQFRVRDKVLKDDDLRVGFTLIGDREVDLNER